MKLVFTPNDSNTETHRNSHSLEVKQRKDVGERRWPAMEISLQNPGSVSVPFLQNKTKTTQVACLNNSQKIQTEIQKIKTDKTASHSGYDSNPTASESEEMFLRD